MVQAEESASAAPSPEVVSALLQVMSKAQPVVQVSRAYREPVVSRAASTKLGRESEVSYMPRVELPNRSRASSGERAYKKNSVLPS